MVRQNNVSKECLQYVTIKISLKKDVILGENCRSKGRPRNSNKYFVSFSVLYCFRLKLKMITPVGD